MDDYLALSASDQRLYCEQAQAQLDLPATSIEKDFWVCWTLRELFDLPDWGKHLAFKGGTSLSKAWKLIDRFSEDLDIVIDREFLGFPGERLGDKRLRKLLKKCSERIHGELLPLLAAHFQKILPETAKWTIASAPPDKDPDQQTLLFAYPTVFPEAPKYVQPVVQIEMGARSETEPSETPSILPYLCDAFPGRFGAGSFSIKTVAARRTFWDKALLLHEETFRPADKPRKRPLARHYYDLWSLIRKGVDTQALADVGLFDRVVAHRQAFFNYGWVDYKTMRSGSLRLQPLTVQLSTWRSDYAEMKREMFIGDAPPFDEVLRVVGEFERRFNRLPQTV